MEDYFSEGDKCPKCDEGTMAFPQVEGCSCHINPPCSACVDNILTCDECGWIDPASQNEWDR